MSVGSCLLANDPSGLGQKMIDMRIQGKSWKEIADEYHLGSPGAARNKFTKLTGIKDYKTKGNALKQMIEQMDSLGAGDLKSAAQAVKSVDNVVDAADPVKSAATKNIDDWHPKVDKFKIDEDYYEAASGIGENYGEDVFSQVEAMLNNNELYSNIAKQTGVNIKDIDEFNWQRLLGQNDGDVWKAYLKKPTSERGLKAVKDVVAEGRARGLTVKEIAKHADIPEGVVDSIVKGTWKAPSPGSVQAIIPDVPERISLSGPTNTMHFEWRSQDEWREWINSLGQDMTPSQRSAVKKYTGSHYGRINSHLRGSPVSRPDLAIKTAKQLEAAMRPVPFDVMVTRKVGVNAFRSLGINSPSDLKKFVGQTYKDTGFMSTSVPQYGTWSGSVKMEIAVPKGTLCRWVDNISTNQGEMEVILNRGMRMMMTEFRVENGQTIVRMEII